MTRTSEALKANEIRLVTYIPDNVLSPLLKAVHDDSYFTVICPAREEEACGIVAGAYITITGGAGAMTGTAPDIQLPWDFHTARRTVLGRCAKRFGSWRTTEWTACGWPGRAWLT